MSRTISHHRSAVIRIDSLGDPRIDPFRDVRDADLRGRDKLFLAESEQVVRRLIDSPMRMHSMLLSPQRLERMRDVIGDVPTDVPIYVADHALMTQISGYRIHGGALAAGVRPSRGDPSVTTLMNRLNDRSDICLVLAEGITHVDNIGAIFRNAAAFGADGVVLDPNCADPLFRKAIRVSMGHVLSMPFAVSDRWIDDLKMLKEQWGITLIGAESTERAMPLKQLPKHQRLGVVFGSERHGLSDESLVHCDAVYEIPMAAGVPSLNVAVASAVVLYELRRNR